MGHFTQNSTALASLRVCSGRCSLHKGDGINLNGLVHINDKLVSSLSFGKYSVVFMVLINTVQPGTNLEN